MAHFTQQQDYAITELFKQMDSDGSGTIDGDELLEILVAEGVDLRRVPLTVLVRKRN